MNYVGYREETTLDRVLSQIPDERVELAIRKLTERLVWTQEANRRRNEALWAEALIREGLEDECPWLNPEGSPREWLLMTLDEAASAREKHAEAARGKTRELIGWLRTAKAKVWRPNR